MPRSCACSSWRAATHLPDVTDLVPEADERVTARAWQGACCAPTRAAAGATPVEVFFGPQGEFARRIYVSPLGVGARARDGAILYVIDATEQKALELKFAQSHKMEAVGQLAGGVAHDFNNVLTAIIGFSDLLLQTHRPTDPAYRDIMNIKSSANRAAGLVRQLLAYSRRQTLQAEVLELGELHHRPFGSAQQGAGREDRSQNPARARSVARQGRQDAVRARHHQSGRQCQGRHARRRLPHDPHAQRVGAREPEAWRASASLPASTCWSRWRTPASAYRRMSSAGSSSRSSPPRMSARAPGSASPRSTASSSRPAATSSPTAKWARARPSASTCRAISSRTRTSCRSAPRRRSRRAI